MGLCFLVKSNSGFLEHDPLLGTLGIRPTELDYCLMLILAEQWFGAMRRGLLTLLNRGSVQLGMALLGTLGIRPTGQDLGVALLGTLGIRPTGLDLGVALLGTLGIRPTGLDIGVALLGTL